MIPISKVLLINKLTTYSVMSTEDPTLTFRNHSKRQDVFTEKIDPKPKVFKVLFPFIHADI